MKHDIKYLHKIYLRWQLEYDGRQQRLRRGEGDVHANTSIVKPIFIN